MSSRSEIGDQVLRGSSSTLLLTARQRLGAAALNPPRLFVHVALRLLPLVMMLAGAAAAFSPATHNQITREALIQPGLGFLPMAIVEIANANECVDTGAYGGDTTNKPCVPGVASIAQQKAAAEHFDDEMLLEGSRWLATQRSEIRRAVQLGYFIEARKRLGFALHALQDFYAHSNWVDLGTSGIFRELLALDTYSPASPSSNQPKFPSNAEVCRDGAVLLSNASAPGGDTLTTGYFFKDDFTATGAPPGKCSHGFIRPGIAKDKESAPLHKLARTRALEHSIEFVADCVSEISSIPGALDQFFGVFRVSTNKKNRLLDVLQGEVYEFLADPLNQNQQIVWGYNSLFGLSNPVSSGPEGTPGVSRANYRWYVTPPIPKANVGALVGQIYGPGCALERPATGAACISLGDLEIGRRARLTMPASGALYLFVNDYRLGNNSGHFDLSFTLVQEASR